MPRLLRKIFIIAIIFSTITPAAFFFKPSPAKAGVDYVVGDFSYENRKGPGGSGFGLDLLGWTIAKRLLRALTAQTVEFIRTGNSGRPFFVSNIKGFFRNAADEALGGALTDVLGPQVCEPFKISLKLAFQQYYFPYRERARCTLSQILKNALNPTVSYSIQRTSGGLVQVSAAGTGPFGAVGVGGGLTAPALTQPGLSSANAVGGIDFRPDVVDVRNLGSGSTWEEIAKLGNPGNNFYSDYFMGLDEINAKQRELIRNRELELSSNNGFLSMKPCKRYERDDLSGKPACVEYENYITTPGSVIASQLGTALGTEFRTLEAINEINQILAAGIDRLISYAIGQGSAGGGILSFRGGENTSTNYWNLPDTNQIGRDLSAIAGQETADNTHLLAVKNESLNAIIYIIREMTALKTIIEGTTSPLTLTPQGELRAGSMTLMGLVPPTERPATEPQTITACLIRPAGATPSNLASEISSRDQERDAIQGDINTIQARINGLSGLQSNLQSADNPNQIAESVRQQSLSRSARRDPVSQAEAERDGLQADERSWYGKLSNCLYGAVSGG